MIIKITNYRTNLSVFINPEYICNIFESVVTYSGDNGVWEKRPCFSVRMLNGNQIDLNTEDLTYLLSFCETNI